MSIYKIIPWNKRISFVSKYKQKIELKIKMKGFFPESLGQKLGCALYMGAHYTHQNMVSPPANSQN